MKAVLGGGVGGLSAAHYLLKAVPSSQIVVVEAENRFGGWIRSDRHENGALFEQGPRTVRPRFEAGSNTLNLIEELGIAHKVKGVPMSQPASRNRMIYVGGKLHMLPSSFKEMLVTKTPFSRPLLSVLLKDIQTPPHHTSDDSLYNFVERRFGGEVADYLISPMVCGIYAGDAKEISVKSLMKTLFEFEQKHGSVSRGLVRDTVERWRTVSLFKKSAPVKGSLIEKARKERWSVWSLDGGLERLPEALMKSVSSLGGELLLNSCCSNIKFVKDGAVLTIGNKDLKASHVVSTLSANKLAPLLAEQHPELCKELMGIPSVTVAVVNLAYKSNILKHDAFGFLIPPSEGKPILGVIFDTCSFPQEGFTVLTVMMGGRWFDSRLGESLSNEDILKIAVSQVESILRVSEKCSAYNVSVLKDCISQYVVGHSERVERIRSYVSKNNLCLSLAGSSFDGVGVNDVILSSKNAANAILESSS